MCEKEKLLSERNQLKVCMTELWQNLSFLSQQVCREVQSGQAPPVSASIDLTSNPSSPSSDKGSSRARSPMSQPSEAALVDRQCRVDVLGLVQEETPLVLGSPEEVCSPTVTVDFCQEMTEKCTTGTEKTGVYLESGDKQFGL